jgi:hypothetical protein
MVKNNYIVPLVSFTVPLYKVGSITKLSEEIASQIVYLCPKKTGALARSIQVYMEIKPK